MSHTFKAQVDKAWPACRLLLVALALAALLVGSVECGVANAAEQETTYVVDANATPCMASNHHFTKIQDAVTAAASDPGVTIDVCPGKYGEQVVINTSLTLRGVSVPSANNGKGADAAIITAPSGGLSQNATFNFIGGSYPLYAQVVVNASDVTLSDLAIDGTSGLPQQCSSSPIRLAGIDFDSGSSGTVRRLAVRNQFQSNGNNPPRFCLVGFGILANQGAGAVTVRDSSISNFDNVGIRAEVPIQVEHNAITQATSLSAGGPIFAFGVLLDTSAAPPSTISSNLVVTGGGIECSNITDGCPGITIKDNDVVITYGGCGIYVTGVGATIDGNRLSGASYFEFAIMAFGTNDVVTDNTMTSLGPLQPHVEGIGIQLNANANDTVTGNAINEAGYGIQGVTGNTVQNNTFRNVDILTTP